MEARSLETYQKCFLPVIACRENLCRLAGSCEDMATKEILANNVIHTHSYI
jgi:hypothetical protein